MAAMFKAQTANWEETQEKMTQLVSRLCGFIVLCSRSISHERDLFFSPFLFISTNETVPCASTLIHEVLAFLVVVDLIRLTSNITHINLSDHYLQVMYVIVVDKKVRISFEPLILN
jgi:hypothetical protein